MEVVPGNPQICWEFLRDGAIDNAFVEAARLQPTMQVCCGSRLTAQPPWIAGILFAMTLDDAPLFCDRCSTELVPGKGNFYVVKIEAVADPSPPVFDEEDLNKDPLQEIDSLIERAREMSQQELLDQVYRRVTIYLCLPCYTEWIEHPAG